VTPGDSTAQLPPWLVPVFTNLLAALDANRLPHALLIHGPGGWGEALLADAFALRLVERSCQDRPSAATVAHPDLRWLAPEGAGEQIKIDSVRSVADFIVQTPQIAPRKVAVLAGAETMNPHAANALLKTLEEPPQDSYLILVTDSISDLLPTLRSRCRLIAVRPSSLTSIRDWVQEAVPGANPEHVAALAFEYGGSPYRLIAALERNEQPISAQLRDVVLRKLDPLKTADAWGAGSTLEIVERWMRYLPLILGVRHGVAAPDRVPLYDALARAPERRVLNFWEQLAQARGLLRGTTNPNARLLLASLLLDWRDIAMPL
jgi:DNA polymerase-3 subunit delta'